jgi:hypothetical protein
MPGSPGTRAPDLPPGPRAALVIATASYQDPGLSRLRATAEDARALTEVLGDPGIGGFTVTPVLDADERQVRRAVDMFLSGRGTEDVVLVYLSCHGVLDRRNRLYFAAADTVKDQLGSTGIPATWLREQLEECRARQQVVILDCCFSGAFAKGSKAGGDLNLERRLAGSSRGQAILTASRSGEYSFTGDALPGAAVSGSVFTTGLIEGLRTGAADTGGDGYVSVDEAYDFAYRYVLSSGAAQTPQRSLLGGEGAIVLARSPAGVAVTPATLLGELADALESRHPWMRIGAVHELGSWLVGDDPDRALAAEQQLRQIADDDNYTVAAAARAHLTAPGRAVTRRGSDTRNVNIAAVSAEEVLEPGRGISDRRARLLAAAELAAQYITDRWEQASALHKVAKAVTVTDPDRAERIAKSIIDGADKVSALSEIAEVVAANDPDRAARLFADAERVARSITSRGDRTKALLLSGLAKAVGATSPDGAERIAQSIASKSQKALALCGVAEAVAVTDPDRAARLLAEAERIVQSITKEWEKAPALRGVVKAVVVASPDCAARLLADAELAAQSMTHELEKALTLLEIAEVVAVTDPDRAARLLVDVELAAQAIMNRWEKASLLSRVAEAVAATDPDRAERIAQSFSNEGGKASLLSRVAEAVAVTDPDRADRLLAEAERIAQSITNEEEKASALYEIAMATV